MRFNISTALVAIVVVLVVTSLSLFTVDQRQNAIVFRLGEIVSVKRRNSSRRRTSRSWWIPSSNGASWT
jgi:regulator of protease activity HflC (stomatin/prohibitin superfamily)